MTARNVFEAEGRAKKCAALIRAIDSELREQDRTHGRSDALTAAFLRSRDDAFWKQLAKQHGIRPPSAATIEAVCLEMEARAEESLSADVESAFESLETDANWEQHS